MLWNAKFIQKRDNIDALRKRSEEKENPKAGRLAFRWNSVNFSPGKANGRRFSSVNLTNKDSPMILYVSILKKLNDINISFSWMIKIQITYHFYYSWFIIAFASS